MDANSRYCEAQVREFDRDRYLATLFAPASHRGALHALHSFDIELSRVRELAREPMPGEIRLQWWREVLDAKRESEARANPVAAALLDALDRYGIARGGLQAMIDARAFDLYNEPFATIADWYRYADATQSELIAKAMHILAGSSAGTADIVRHAGLASVGVNTLRRLPLHLSRGQCFVPLEMIDHFGAKLEDGLAGRITPEWRAALAEMRLHVRRNLDAAAGLIDKVPRLAMPALLPCAVMRLASVRMEKDSYDPLRPPDLPQWRRQWLLWRAARNPRRIFG